MSSTWNAGTSGSIAAGGMAEVTEDLQLLESQVKTQFKQVQDLAAMQQISKNEVVRA